MSNLSRQRNLFFMMVLATICCGLLVMIRIGWQHYQLPDIKTFREFVQARGMTFFFLLWNLALAWVPYLMALRIGQLQRQDAGWLRLTLGLGVWLAFLPNAPYLITDFVQFRHLPPVPVWFDLILLFAAASTGLLLGLLSIYEVHQVLKKWFSKAYSNLIILSAIGLSGFGIWLGRFQRWNSWDILTRPMALLSDILETFTTRHELAHALGISGLLSGVLLMGYGILTALMHTQTSSK